MADRKLLVVEDRPGTLHMLEETLADEGYRAVGVPTAELAMERLRDESFELVLTDLNLPGKDGLQVLAAARENDPLAPVIVMTAYGTVENAVRAMKDGAYDFVTKPVDTDRLLLLVKRALEKRTLEVRNRGLRAGVEAPVIVGAGPAIRDTLRLAEKVARSDAAVLLLGESGTGKELFARAIHGWSARAAHPMVAVNCAAMPRDLIEAELFGAEKGAYTGADRLRVGKFELADGGTLFFDEIGELRTDLQSKLLRVLEEHSVERLGGSRSIPVDVRLITATNRNLEEDVAEGRFREDLYYRLNVFPIRLPSLRERREDIPVLAEHFLAAYSRELRRDPVRLSPEATEAILAYDWPGNIRELRNVLERAVILAEGETITGALVRPAAAGAATTAGVVPLPRERFDFGPGAADLHAAVRNVTRRVEADIIGRVLRECGGNKSEAARRMKISYRSLWTKVKEYGLE
ncbi:MAG: sigma-54-dependent Fis family transcriptional regulator [Candidatus Eisenbacteria bacterium]|nr:sigma-54-dependent Fis family transcriptional regulator [Candidatus Eisenbacteria bacterium]